MPLKVLIAGGGIGGLCLAQALRRAGVEAQVYERDTAIEAREQGYRIRITPDGDEALRECLPARLYALYRATCSQPSAPPLGAYDPQLTLIYRLAGGDPAPTKSGDHLAVHRRTLRQVLLGGLGEGIQWGDAILGFAQDEAGVEVRLASGRSVRGDVLVAADGLHSAVRRQMLPDATIFETDMRCIYGMVPLDDGVFEALPDTLQGGFTPVLGPDRCTLALGPFRAQHASTEAAQLAPDIRLDLVRDYLMWMFVAPKGTLPPGDASPEALHRHVLDRTQGWHPALRWVLERADIPVTFPVTIRSARPMPPWPTGRVTLLGDAIHAMTPAGGIGANTALFDAALLARAFTAVARGDSRLADALSQYGAVLRKNGFAAVERSLQAAASLYRVSVPPAEVFT